MQRFSEFIIRFKWIIIPLVIVLTLVFAYQLRNLKINSDILSYLPQNDPAVVLFNEVGEKFGGNSLAMVALETDDIFKANTLSRIRKLTSVYEEIEGVADVISLTNILDIKKIEGGIEVGKLIDKNRIPEDEAELKALRDYTLKKGMYVGSLVSSDGTVTVILCRIKADVDEVEVARNIKRATKEIQGEEKVYYAGMPFQMAYSSDIILGDMSKLTPIVALLVMLILFFSFRSFRGVFLPLSTVLISLIWAAGLMSAMGYSITMISGIMPVLLIAVGSAYGIHAINKYYEDVREDTDKEANIKKALSEVGLPIILAGATTLIGFLSLMTSNLSLIKEFGLFTAIGIFFATVISITFLPAILATLKVKRITRNEAGVQRTAITRFMDRLSAFVLKREKTIVAITLLISIATLTGLPKLRREANMVEYFKKTSEPRIAEELMEKKFGGSMPIQIYVEGDIKNPFALKQMRMIEKYLASLPNVNNPQSIADLICEMNDVMNDRYTIPDTEEGVGNLWFFIEGNDILESMINSKATEAVIQAKLGTINTAHIIKMVDQIRGYLKENVPEELVTLNMEMAPPELQKALEKERVERIVNKIVWDVKREMPDYQIDTNRLENIIEGELSSNATRFDEKLIAHTVARIGEYFASDEADIEVERENIETLKAAFAKSLAKGELQLSKVKTILRSNIAAEIINSDPEAIDYAAESIEAIIAEESREARVSACLAEINGLLPEELTKEIPPLPKGGRGDFLRDLKADVWEVNENFVAMGKEEYTKIVNSGEEKIDPVKFSAQQSGMPPIFAELDKQMLRSQIQSLLIALLLVFFLLSVQFRSIVGGLISVVPIALTILINFGVMSYLSIPLDNATMMIASIAIGIGIDYAIHFTSRFKVEFTRRGNEFEALEKTLETTGVAITINAVSVMIGFLVLLMSSLVPLQRFGWLTALTMLISALSAITVLPALILLTKARFVKGENQKVL